MADENKEELNEEQKEQSEQSEEIEELGGYEGTVSIHASIDELYVGHVVNAKQDYAKTRFRTTREMIYDSDGLIFNAFIYTAASWAAQVAINKQYLITVASRVSFLAPAKVGDIVEFEANAFFSESKKQEVRVVGTINEIRVFEGSFSVIMLEDHILKIQKRQLDKQAKESREIRAKQKENA